MKIRVPANADPDTIQMVREINAALEKIDGANNRNYSGRRITNAGDAQDQSDYATLRDVGKVFESKMAVRDAAAAKRAAQVAAGSGGGDGGGGDYTSGTPGGGGGVSGPAPLVPLPNDIGIVQAYAAAHPDQIANSCQPPAGSGTWDFMDGVVADLRAKDSRYGYNGERGNVSDPSHDAISYYHGEMGSMTVGSNAVYVVDIVGGHCGNNPQPAWINVTGSGGALGAWLPNR